MGSEHCFVAGNIPNSQDWLPSKQEVTSSIHNYYKSKRYSDPSILQSLEILNITADPVFNCSIKSLVEERALDDRIEPHDGSPIEESPLPPLWETAVPIPDNYEDKIETVKFPGTKKARTCPTCKGNRKVACNACAGAGRLACTKCGGSGKNCTCDGGYLNCQTCRGLRELECPACRGYGQLSMYKALVSNFTVTSVQVTNETKTQKNADDSVSIESVDRVIIGGDIPTLPDLARELALHLLTKAPQYPFRPMPDSTKIQHRQRLEISQSRKAIVSYTLAGHTGEFAILGKEPGQEIQNFPVRRDFRKIGRHLLVAIVTISIILAGMFIFNWRSKETQYNAAKVLLTQDKYEEAHIIFNKLSESEYKDSTHLRNETSFKLATQFFETSQLGKAVEILEKPGLANWPGSTELLNEARFNLYVMEGEEALKKTQFPAALAAFARASKINLTSELSKKINSAKRQQAAAALGKYRSGNQEMRKRNYAAAISLFKIALAIDPSYKRATNAKANAEKKLNEKRREESRLASIRTSDPTNHLKITNWSWSVSDFSVATINVSVKNNSPFVIKDVQFAMDYLSSSGTSLGTGRETAYQKIEPGRTRRFKLEELADRRAKRANIVIKSAKWEWQASERNLDF